MKKSLLNIIMIVLVLTNTILTTIMLFVVVPGMQDSNRIIKKVAQAVNLELDTREIDVSDVPLDECETFDLETKLTIALKKGSDGKDHYAVIYPTLLLYKNGSNSYREESTCNTAYTRDCTEVYSYRTSD